MPRRFHYLAVVLVLPLFNPRAEFYPYEILLSAEKVDERIADFLERNLPQSRLVAMPAQTRYQKFPHFPVPACKGVEYYLIAFGKRLIAFGCLSADAEAIAIEAMRRAIDLDRQAEQRRSPAALESLVLASAATGDFAAARRFAQELRQKRPGAARNRRWERLLER